MTVCISAIGKTEQGEEVVVLATDHMLTLENIGSFEHDILKWRKMNSNSVAMLSGKTLLFTDTLKNTEGKPFFVVADEIDKNIRKLLEKKINKILLDKFKLTFNDLKALIANPNINQLASNIITTVDTYKLGTSILLVGFDEERKAQIIEISEADMNNFRDIGFGAIGSGGAQAINTLLFQKHSCSESVRTATYNVYKAKRNSEVSQGVGKDTQLCLFYPNGNIKRMNEKGLKILSEIYDDELALGKENEKLNLEEAFEDVDQA
jgi:hypothetical protein